MMLLLPQMKAAETASGVPPASVPDADAAAASCLTPTRAVRLGLVFNTACGPLLEVAAYTFAPQSTLAPFGGLDTVWNALLAPCTLGEKFTKP